MCRGMTLVAAAALVISAACSQSVDAPDATVTQTPLPRAVYLSIGDSIQYGCCADTQRSAGELFRRYLSERLNRDVEWITVADNGTARDFLDGIGGGTPQIERAVGTMKDLQAAGRPIVAITMSIGGNDYVEVGERCAAPPCTGLFREVLERMKGDLNRLYPAIVAAKPANTPLMVVLYYNASDCGQPGVDTSPTELGQRVWNASIDEIARANGAFMVDAYTPFRGRACELIDGVDPNYAGYEVLEAAYEQTYGALPDELIHPHVVK